MKVDIKKDLQRLFSGFKWKMESIINSNGKVHPIPRIPQVITGLFEDFARRKIVEFARKNYKCEIIEAGSREYPEITLTGGVFGEKEIAVDIKTTRRLKQNRVSGFTIGSYAKYFLHPDKKMAGCKFPYGEFAEHWIVGFIYTWNPDAENSGIVSDVEVIVQEKWRIASKSTGTGTTFAIGSIKDIEKLKRGEGQFKNKEEFESFWREKGKVLAAKRGRV